MRIRWETINGVYLGIGAWKDEPLYLGPDVDEENPFAFYIVIMLIFGFLEIRLGR